jgi:hypothetical protein
MPLLPGQRVKSKVFYRCVSSITILLPGRGYHHRDGFDYFDLAGDVYVGGLSYFLPGAHLAVCCHPPGDLPVVGGYLRACFPEAYHLQGVSACYLVLHWQALVDLPVECFD